MNLSLNASFRPQIPVTAIALSNIAGNITAPVAGNIRVQFQNRSGRNLLSEAIAFSLAASEGLRITINNGAIATGEEVFYVVFSYENTGVDTDSKWLCTWKARQDDQQTAKVLPATIDLSEDEHFAIDDTAVDASTLPTKVVQGMVRLVTDTYYRYEAEAIAVGGVVRLYGVVVGGNVIAAAIGYWVRHTYGVSTHLASTTVAGGSDRLLIDSTDSLSVPQKDEIVDSLPRRVWVLNGYDEDAQSPLVTGTRYNLRLKVGGSAIAPDGTAYDDLFANKIKIYLRGYVRRSTGVLDTGVAGVGTELVWHPDTARIQFLADLPRGYAAVYDLVLSFTNATLASQVGAGVISLNIVPASDISGGVVGGVSEQVILNNAGQIASVQSSLNGHVADAENPHSVTAAQVGAPTIQQLSSAIALIQTNIDAIAAQAALIAANTTAINNLPVVQAYSVNTIAERNALLNVVEGSIVKVADSGSGSPANYFYNDGAWEQYADLTGASNNVYEVADIAARDALTGVIENDIAKVADDGTGAARDYIYNGTAWLAFIGAASGSANNVYEVADIATRDGLTGVIEGDIAKVGDDGAGVARDYVYTGTVWLPFSSAVQTGAEIKAALEGLVDPNKLLGSAIAGFKNITGTAFDDYVLGVDLGADTFTYRAPVTNLGAGAILLPVSQAVFTATDGTLASAFTPQIGTAQYEDIKLIATAATPDNQTQGNQMQFNVPNTGIVIDLGNRDAVYRIDWVFNTGDNDAILARYESDGNMVRLNLSGSAIVLETVVADAVTTVNTQPFTFTDGTIYKIELYAIGLTYMVLIDNVEVLSDIDLDAFLTATKFGFGRIV